MAGFGGGAPTALGPAWYLTPQTILALAVGCIGSTPWMARTARGLDLAEPAVAVGRAALVGALFVVSLLFIAASSYNPFIYFRF
jgi:hypothetical protein